ncbi:hypothetical protein [Salmonella phage PHA46]
MIIITSRYPKSCWRQSVQSHKLRGAFDLIRNNLPEYRLCTFATHSHQQQGSFCNAAGHPFVQV